MSLSPIVNKSIAEEEQDFFAPVVCAREASGIISLDELKQMWDERQEEKRRGEQALEELVQRELGVSFEHARSNLQKQLSFSPRQGKKTGQDEEGAEQIERMHSNPFRKIIEPFRSSKSKKQNLKGKRKLLKQQLLDGSLFKRCQLKQRCSEEEGKVLVDLALRAGSNNIVAQYAVDLYVSLINKQNPCILSMITFECDVEYVPCVRELLEMFDSLGDCGRKQVNEYEQFHRITLQTRNWLMIVRTIYENENRNSFGGNSDECMLVYKIASLWLDQGLGITLEQDITLTIKTLLSVIDTDQQNRIVTNLSELLTDIAHNASGALRIGQKIPFVSQASMDDRGAILRMRFCYLSFLTFYPIQEDIKQAKKGVKRSRKGKPESCSNFVQEMLSVLKLQKSPKILLDGFCIQKEQVQNVTHQMVEQNEFQSPKNSSDIKESASPRRNQPDYILLERCLNLLELVCSTYIIECCRQKKVGEQGNESLKLAIWDVIEYSKELQLAIQRRKGDDMARLFALDAATSLQLHNKWNLQQEE